MNKNMSSPKDLVFINKEENQSFLSKKYEEALYYMSNAKENLQKAGKDGKYYKSEKYVSTACGVAYKAALIAIEAYLKSMGIKKPIKHGSGRVKVDFYTENLGKLNGKYLKIFNTTYRILHLEGYYDGETKVDIIKSGFESANELINLIKP